MTVTVFLGKFGSGKGFASKGLLEDGAVKISFADELRLRAYHILGYEPKNYDDFKKKLIYLDEKPMWISNLLKKWFPKFQTGREILQLTGDTFKLHDKLFWTKLAIKQISEAVRKGKDVVIDDCRFKHELVHIQRFCAEADVDLNIYFCDYRSSLYEEFSKHNSEKMAEFIRDDLKFEDMRKLTVDKCFYYNVKGKRYKTAVPVYANQFLDEPDLLDTNKLNDFEKIVYQYRGE